MKKKRIISLILATTMAATVVVSGCGKSGDSEKTDDGKKKTEASDDKVLEFYHDHQPDSMDRIDTFLHYFWFFRVNFLFFVIYL